MVTFSRRAIAPLAAVLLVALGHIAGANDPGLRPIGRLNVVDARGRLVGEVRSPTSVDTALVVVQAGDRPVWLSVKRDGLLPAGRTLAANFIYETTDCTGQGYLDASGIPGHFDPQDIFPFVVMVNASLYIPGETRQVHLRSFTDFFGANCTQQDLPNYTVLVPVLIASLADEFQPPFRLQIGAN